MKAVAPFNAVDARLIFASFVWRIADENTLVIKSVMLTSSSAPKMSILGNWLFQQMVSKLTISDVGKLPSSTILSRTASIRANAKQSSIQSPSI